MSGGSTHSNQQSANSVYFGGVVDHGQINITGNVGNGDTTFSSTNSATGPNISVNADIAMGGGKGKGKKGGMGMPEMPNMLMMLNTEDLDEEDLENLKFSIQNAFKGAKKGVKSASGAIAKKVANDVKYEATHMTPARAAEHVKAAALSPIDVQAWKFNT